MTPRTIFDHLYAKEEPNPAALKLADTPPPWRRLTPKAVAETGAVAGLERTPRLIDADQAARGKSYRAGEHEARMVNAALMLRRPLLVTGQAGVGKSSLAYAVAWQLGLGNVLRWGVTSRSTLKEALYQYDAIARLHDASLWEKGGAGNPMDIGSYVTLGPLGTALLPSATSCYFPRVLLIDEIDKSDADLPSDLLHVLEDAAFGIPEIARLPLSAKGETLQVQTSDGPDSRATIPSSGTVRCNDFPFIMMTSNGERDFPPAFLRRCLRLEMAPPDASRLLEIVRAHIGESATTDSVRELIADFDVRRSRHQAELATDQLLNAVFLANAELDLDEPERGALLDSLLRSLNEPSQIT